MQGPLDTVNDIFHSSYDAGRKNKRRAALVIVVLADELVIFRGEERRVLSFTPRVFHVIKSAAHVPVALFAGLHEVNGKPRLGALRGHAAEARAALDDDAELDQETRDAIRSVLDASLAFANGLEDGDCASVELDTFARQTGPLLLQLTRLATRVQLTALHSVVETFLAELDDIERAELQVVVTGNHQARARSLGMQYFRKRLQEPEGAEDRVAYAEGVEDPDEALALVGTRRMDIAIATAFFGDAKHLQRDVLGDAVAELLSATKLDPI